MDSRAVARSARFLKRGADEDAQALVGRAYGHRRCGGFMADPSLIPDLLRIAFRVERCGDKTQRLDILGNRPLYAATFAQ